MEKVNVSDVAFEDIGEGDAGFRGKRLANAAGAEDLGFSLYELRPGDRSWPYHYHTANEEALFVLAGSGTLRWGGEHVAIEDGDYVPLAADESGAHRVINDGDEPLRYLMASTRREPEVLVYPDSEKVGVMSGAAPGDDGERNVEGYYRVDDAVDYWDGEE